jgi:hypothetical protein
MRTGSVRELLGAVEHSEDGSIAGLVTVTRTSTSPLRR